MNIEVPDIGKEYKITDQGIGTFYGIILESDCCFFTVEITREPMQLDDEIYKQVGETLDWVTYGCEFEEQVDDYHINEYDFGDKLEEKMEACGMTLDGFCMYVGSEHCQFECPFNEEL